MHLKSHSDREGEDTRKVSVVEISVFMYPQSFQDRKTGVCGWGRAREAAQNTEEIEESNSPGEP